MQEPNVSNEVNGPSGESKQESPPRITSDTVGTKEQRAAAKKLSDYNKEARKKREALRESAPSTTDGAATTESSPPTGPTSPTEQRPPYKPVHYDSEPQQYAVTISNLIAFVGVIVAAGCLWMTYRRDRIRTSKPEIKEEEEDNNNNIVEHKPSPRFRTL